MNFSQRSYQKELLDHDDIPFVDIKQQQAHLSNYLKGKRKSLFVKLVAGAEIIWLQYLNGAARRKLT